MTYAGENRELSCLSASGFSFQVGHVADLSLMPFQVQVLRAV
jgi:hypothetical protein